MASCRRSRPAPRRCSSPRSTPSLFGAARRLAAQWRAAGLRVELYPDAAKLDRQLKYADAKNIPFVAILGPDEAATNSVTLKDLRSKSQQRVAQELRSRALRAA